MQISISNVIGRAINLGSYASKLIKAFKARVLSYPTSIFEAEACLSASLKQLKNIGLLDDASLVITPNAYNEGVLYDVVPNTTLGDMDVVRATTGTRVNSSGLVETVPYNLVKYSQDFTNLAWVKQSTTVTLETGISPLNTPIYKMLASGGFSQIYQSPLILNNIYSTRVLIKKGNVRYAYFRMANFSYYDFDTNTFGGTNASKMTSQILSDNWVLIIINEYICTETESNMYQSNTGSPYGSVLGDFTFISLYQTNDGAIKTYFPTTTRLNIPRIDYTNGTCPSLLVEPQRTNLLTYSQNFSNSSWSKIDSNITSGFLSPDGTNNAFKLIENNNNSNHFIRKSVSTLNNNSYTISIFAKYFDRRYILLKDLYSNKGGWFDLINGTLTSFNGGVCKITSLSNGFFRCDVTLTTIDVAIVYDIYVSNTQTTSYLGNGTSGVFLWGAQTELGSYATSYIPTVASTVTRNADVISKTGISSLIGQTEGTLFCDVLTSSIELGDSNTFVSVFGNINNRVVIGKIQGTSNLFYYVSANGSITFQIITKPLGRYKIALAYKSGNSCMYINGVSVFTNTNSLSFSTALTDLYINQRPIGYEIGKLDLNSSILYKTRLTNAELAQLTTL